MITKVLDSIGGQSGPYWVRPASMGSYAGIEDCIEESGLTRALGCPVRSICRSCMCTNQKKNKSGYRGQHSRKFRLQGMFYEAIDEGGASQVLNGGFRAS